MNQIACCDWPPEQTRWRYLALLTVSFVKNFPESQIVNPLLTKLFWLSSFFLASIWTSTPSRSINMQKKNWQMFSHTAHNNTHFLHMHLCNLLSDCLFFKVMKPFNLCRQAWHQVILFSLLWWWVQHQVGLCFLSHRPWPWQNFLEALCRPFLLEAHLKVLWPQLINWVEFAWSCMLHCIGECYST